MNNDALIFKVSMETSGVDSAGASVDQALKRVTGAAQSSQKQIGALGAQSKLTAQQMQQVGYQVNDFAVQILSGQSAVTALVQQGSQLSGTFGGIGGAVRALGTLVTVANVALAAGALVVGGLGYAYLQARDRAIEFSRYLVLTGNSAGVAAGELQKLSQRVAADTKVSTSAAYELASAYAYSGKVGPESLESITRAVARLAQLSGRSTEDIRKEFAGLFDKPSAGALKLNEQYNFLNAEMARHIVKLEQQGKKEEAIRLVAEELDKTLKSRSETIEVEIGLWERLKRAASDALNATVGLFDAPTLDDRINQTAREARFADKRGPVTRDLVAGGRDRQQLNADALRLIRQRDNEAIGLATAAQQAAKSREAVSKILGDAGKKPKDPPRDFLGEGLDKLNDELRDRLNKVLDSEDEANAKLLEKSIENYKRRSDAGKQFGEQLSDQATVLSISLIQDQEARGRAQIAFERSQILERLDDLKLEGDEYSRIWSAAQDQIAARNAQLTEELKPEWQKQLDAWRDTNRLMRDSFNEFQTGWLREGESAWVSFVKTGKFSLTSLVDFAIEEFARLQFRQNIAPGLASLGQSLFSFLSGTGGGDAPANASQIASARGNAFTHGAVHAMASGGILGPNGGLLTRPTIFPMRNGGIGIGGEAGVESVMPLRRTASGQLGVIAQGGGAPIVNVNIQGAPSQPSVRQRPNGQGGVDIDVVFEQFRGRLVDDVQNGGPMGNALQTQYGVNRAQGLMR